MGGGCPQGTGFEWTPELQATNHKWSRESIEKGLTRNTIRSWCIALDTMKELKNCLQKLQRWLTRKRRSWVKQQKAEVKKLELRSQLGRTWDKIMLEYFENEKRAPYSAQLLMEYVASCSHWVNTRESGNNSQSIPFRSDSQRTLLVPGV